MADKRNPNSPKNNPYSLKNNDSPLDDALLRELEEEARPADSPLSASEVSRHASAIRREEYALERREEKSRTVSRRIYQVLSVLAALTIICILLLNILELPVFGHQENPTNNEVPARYLTRGLEEGGAVNLVADLILDYRAFDTLGESNVLFAAACTVILLLRAVSEQEEHTHGLPKPVPREEAPEDPILTCASCLLVPVILLFGVYIILNGHLGPGGGFAGGAVMGAGLILYLNAFGEAQASRILSFRSFRNLSAGALIFYALSKAWSFFCGANGLEMNFPLGTPGSILSGGLILPLNMAVGLVVCCTMYAFFALFRKGEI